MRKMRFWAGLLALLMLLMLVSCNKEPDPSGPSQDPPPPATDNGNGEATDNSQPNTDPDADPDSDPDVFQQNNGYPMTFSVHFTKDGYGFSTATGEILNGSETVYYTFTADDYRDLYRCLDEGNLWMTPSDLTYSTLAGESAPNGAGSQYELIVVNNDQTKTYRIDEAAITYLSSTPHVGNMGSIVNYLFSCVEMYHDRAA